MTIICQVENVLKQNAVSERFGLIFVILKRFKDLNTLCCLFLYHTCPVIWRLQTTKSYQNCMCLRSMQ